METQTMEIAESLPFEHRARFYKLVKIYKEKKSPKVARELEKYGLSIDEKDYGADQNIEKGATEY